MLRTKNIKDIKFTYIKITSVKISNNFNTSTIRATENIENKRLKILSPSGNEPGYFPSGARYSNNCLQSQVVRGLIGLGWVGVPWELWRSCLETEKEQIFCSSPSRNNESFAKRSVENTRSLYRETASVWNIRRRKSENRLHQKKNETKLGVRTLEKSVGRERETRDFDRDTRAPHVRTRKIRGPSPHRRSFGSGPSAIRSRTDPAARS